MDYPFSTNIGFGTGRIVRATRAYLLVLILSACSPSSPDTSVSTPQCDVSLLVLGVAQDAGKPQIGNPTDPAWADQSLRRLATSIAIVDHRRDKPQRWLFDATPDIKEQLHALNEFSPTNAPSRVDGVFLTHAHIGHYAGLMMFGHEAAGARHIIAYVMPRMATYLGDNGPWNQLVKFENIILAIMEPEEPELIATNLTVTPFLVPHRQEFSEVAGFIINGPNKSALYLPDIDSWEEWDAEGVKIEDKIAAVDIAYIDATFFADGEIPGRDMSGFPHPFVSHSMKRFAALPDEERVKIRFIHMNHTNPLLTPNAPEREAVQEAGFGIAEEKDVFCL